VVGFPEIDDFGDEVLADEDVDRFEVEVHDLVVDQVAHPVDHVE
jgi:hypothetical protein